MTLFHIILSIFGTITWATEVVTTKPPVDIYWNSTNKMFLSSNNDHIIDVHLKDTVQFLCPYYESAEEGQLLEHYSIYRLPKEYYDSCHLPVNLNENQLRELNIIKVHDCNSPLEKLNYIAYIDEFYALPGQYGGISYFQGEMYYFTSISTGSSEGLHNRRSQGSACKERNMKAIVRVCCSDNATYTCPEGSLKCKSPDNTTETTVPAGGHNTGDKQPPVAGHSTAPAPTAEPPKVTWTTLKSYVSTRAPGSTKSAQGTDADKVSDNSANTHLISIAMMLFSSICILLSV